jgi:tRNA-specific 2-thiouridylase
LKFGLLSEKARELGANHLATGHYARVEYDDVRNRFVLKKGLERDKEQSYWLAMLPQEVLGKTLLPLGVFSKNEIRRLAAQFGLMVADKKESQDVCWLGNFQQFVGRCVKSGSGPIVDIKGNVIGTHNGVHLYTVGQRRGLGIPASKPLYVVRIDHETNTIVAGEESALYCRAFVGVKPNWIGLKAPVSEGEVEVKTRYRGLSAKASISTNGAGVLVRFREPQKAITPGQLAVFYRGDEVLAGAWIERAIQ